MKLKIEIDLDNAAFEPDAGSEAARILRWLARDIDYDQRLEIGVLDNLRDLNGNQVGTARIVKG